MGPYLGVFFAALAVDTVPVFSPPVWTLILLGVVYWKIDPWLGSVAGALGSTVGRWLLSLYIPRLTGRFFNARENENIAFLGKKLGGRPRSAFGFVLLYSLTPLSTTALFTAVGVAKVDVRPILPAFFIGKTIGDAVCVLAGRRAVRSAADLLKGEASPQGLAGTALALLVLGALLFIDWRALLQRKKLHFEWRILRGR